jgi:ATP-binding cassette subfamily C exporter for protease/lipase
MQAMWQLKPYVLLAFFLSVFSGLLALAPIGYMREVYGPVVTTRSEWTLAMVTLLLVMALVMAAVIEWVRQRVMSAGSVRLATLLGHRIFEATFFANLHNAKGANTALSDLRQVRMFLASPTAAVILDAPIGLLLLGLIFYINSTMGLLSLVGAALTLIIGLITERAVRPTMTEALERAQLANAYAADASRNAEAIQAMGMLGSVRARWMMVQQDYLAKQTAANNHQSLGTATTKVVMLVQGSALLGVGTMLTLLGHMSPQQGALLIVAKLIGALAVRPLMQLIQSWKAVVVFRDSFTRLEAFLNRIQPPQPGMQLPAPSGALEFRKATVTAPGSKDTLLSDVTVRVEPGQCLAVIGPSGSGKSTLARLATGVWPPRLGEVRLEGVSLSAWPKSELGPHLGYLPQDVELFDGTIRENIARFGPVNAEALALAVSESGLQQILDTLPEGLETLLGSDGARLSGGQRQRVGLARALYGSPHLLVLDEPNASLDAKGDQALAQAIESAKARGAMVVLITHRPEVLELADLLLVLRDGRPVVSGTRQEVLKAMAERKRAALEAQS